MRQRDPDFRPLSIICVFSPPAEGNKDVQQIQEDLPQEKADNQQAPEGKKAALTRIIADYNARFGSNHRIGEFDLYYQADPYTHLTPNPAAGKLPAHENLWTVV